MTDQQVQSVMMILNLDAPSAELWRRRLLLSIQSILARDTSIWRRRRRDTWIASTCLLSTVFCISPALAQSSLSPAEIEALRTEIQALRAEQARAAARLAQLEQALVSLDPSGIASIVPAPVPVSTPVHQVAASMVPSPRLAIQGDFRVRYENNHGDEDARDRERGVLRARLRGTYAVNDSLTLGAQLATGDPDDPNSTDITLSDFNDDLQVSLDQAYLRYQRGGLTVLAGKFPQPLVRTELVWDGDVSPQGLSVSYAWPVGGGSVKATGLYFVIDESASGRDSVMRGGQIALDSGPVGDWRLELAGGYFDYELGSLAGADSGDFRGNRMVGGRYLSDFELGNLIGAVTYQGFGSRWPVRLVGDYVRNFGAIDGEDTGFGLDLLAGRASEQGDWRLGYGYAWAETDAVFAAFSHDNTALSTNYRQHSLTFDYVPVSKVVLNATYYLYRPEDRLWAGANDVDDWLQRLRLNLLVNF